MLRTRLFAFFLLAAAVFVLVLLRDPSRGAVAPAKETTESSGSDSAPEVNLSSGSAPTVEAQRERATSPRAIEGSGMASSEPPLTRVAVSGILLQARDRRPASGIALSFDVGSVTAEVISDERGRFTLTALEPGQVVRVWRVDQEATSGCPRSQEVLPGTFLVSEPETDGPPELELLLAEPDVWLEVQVVREHLPFPAAVLSSGPAFGHLRVDTDPAGRLRLPFCGLREGDEISLRAVTDGFESATASLVHPWPDQPVQLELLELGSVAVSVVDDLGLPVAGTWARCPGSELGILSTSENGRAVFPSVLPGTTLVQVLGTKGIRERVEVPAGGRAEVEFVIERSHLSLVAGRVVDEHGDGLAELRPWCQYGSSWASAVTDPSGRFEVLVPRLDAGAAVRVVLGGGVEDERFDPEEIVVPVGTRDLLFRRRAPLEETEFSLAICDALTHELVPQATVIVHRRRQGPHHVYAVKAGVVSCSVRPYEDVRALVRAIGYQDRVLEWDVLSGASDPEKPLRVALEAGMDLRAYVVDGGTGAPIAGVELLASLHGSERAVAVTDDEGRAHLVLERWPATLRAVVEGYDDGVWDWRELPGEPEARFELAREADDGGK